MNRIMRLARKTIREQFQCVRVGCRAARQFRARQGLMEHMTRRKVAAPCNRNSTSDESKLTISSKFFTTTRVSLGVVAAVPGEIKAPHRVIERCFLTKGS